MQQPDCLTAVAAFHRLFQCPVLRTPAIPAPDRCALRVSLLREELTELSDAIKENDLVEVADALADIQYVLSGAVLEFGMGALFAPLFDEVQRSNMSKACATAEEAEATRLYCKMWHGVNSSVEQVAPAQFLVYRAGDKKVLKSVKHSPPDYGLILAEAEELAQRQEATQQAAAAAAATNGGGGGGGGGGTGVTADIIAMPDTLNAVAAFHKLLRDPVLPTPAIPDAARCALRVSLIAEELKELEDAIAADDLMEVADALCGIQYVLSGAVLEFGMGGLFKALFDEVQRSNMSKACATAEEAEATRQHYKLRYDPPTDSTFEEVAGKFLVYRAGDHKVLKSVKYSPVDFAPLLGQFLPSPTTTTTPATVPVRQIARVARLKIAGEAAAVELDALVRKALKPVKALPGYVKTSRQLCKTEWVYELSVVFDGAASFEAYMAGPLGATLVGPEAAQAVRALGEGDVAFGARVHDDFA